jgi:hypothetical protein
LGFHLKTKLSTAYLNRQSFGGEDNFIPVWHHKQYCHCSQEAPLYIILSHANGLTCYVLKTGRKITLPSTTDFSVFFRDRETMGVKRMLSREARTFAYKLEFNQFKVLFITLV